MSKSKQKPQSSTGPVIALAAVGVVLVGVMVWQGVRTAPSTEQTWVEPVGACTSGLVTATDMPGVEHFPCTAQAHVPNSQRVRYKSDPPTAGAHWDIAAPPGFYRSEQTPERLVHSLEHGNVVIYYNDQKLDRDQMAYLQSLPKTYSGPWDGVIATPRKDDQYPIILTAWEYMLRLESWDQERIDAFVDLFRGRGPENPVRPLP